MRKCLISVNVALPLPLSLSLSPLFHFSPPWLFASVRWRVFVSFQGSGVDLLPSCLQSELASSIPNKGQRPSSANTERADQQSKPIPLSDLEECDPVFGSLFLGGVFWGKGYHPPPSSTPAVFRTGGVRRPGLVWLTMLITGDSSWVIRGLSATAW